MRIISGIFGGKRNPKKAPPGVRPTADAVRESIFNKLTNTIDITGLRCMDVFAGTGAMGFEALSRGASHCTLIEKNRKTAQYIISSAEIFSIPEKDYNLIQMDALKALDLEDIKKSRFELVFIDPPYYKNEMINPILEKMLHHSILSEDAVVTVEHSAMQGFILPEGYGIIDEKTFGETKVVFLINELM
mgnify:FL=1